MYRRIITSLIVALVGLSVAVPVASARYSQQALVRQQLGEVGAWAVPVQQHEPSAASLRALAPERLREIGAWTAPSTPTTTKVASSGSELNGQNVGIGAALALGALVLGVAGVASVRRHRPVVH